MVSCMADSWTGVNNWSAESVGMAGGLRRSSTEDLALENSSTSSSEASCSKVDVFGFSGDMTIFACASVLNSLAA